jgi:hypothetical protein
MREEEQSNIEKFGDAYKRYMPCKLFIYPHISKSQEVKNEWEVSAIGYNAKMEVYANSSLDILRYTTLLLKREKDETSRQN